MFEKSTKLSRRTTLYALAGFSISGCSLLTERYPKLTLYNDTTHVVEPYLVITDLRSNELVVDESVKLGANPDGSAATGEEESDVQNLPTARSFHLSEYAEKYRFEITVNGLSKTHTTSSVGSNTIFSVHIKESTIEFQRSHVDG